MAANRHNTNSAGETHAWRVCVGCARNEEDPCQPRKHNCIECFRQKVGEAGMQVLRRIHGDRLEVMQVADPHPG